MEPPRVLIVDDEGELVNALTERLNLRGFEAEGVTSGTDALERITTSSYDVVLLDVKMPGLGGLEVIRMIKQRQPKLQVIMLTGHGSVQDAEQGMEAGAFAYLQKPVNIDALVRTLLSATEPGEGGGD